METGHKGRSGSHDETAMRRAGRDGGRADGRLMVTVRLNFYLVIAVKPPPARSGSEKADASQGWTFWTGLPCSGGCWMGSGQGGANAFWTPTRKLAFVRKESRRVCPLFGPLAASASRYAVEKENGRNAEE